MCEVGRDLDLAQKTFCANGCCQVRIRNLDRDLAVVLQVPGRVDRSYPTAADLTLDGVAVARGCLQSFEVGVQEREPSCEETARSSPPSRPETKMR